MVTPSITASNPFSWFDEIRGALYNTSVELDGRPVLDYTPDEIKVLRDSYNASTAATQEQIDTILKQRKNADPVDVLRELQSKGLIDDNGKAAFSLFEKLSNSSGADLKDLLAKVVKSGKVDSDELTNLISHFSNSGNLDSLFGKGNSHLKELVRQAASSGNEREMLEVAKQLNKLSTSKPGEVVKLITKWGNLQGGLGRVIGTAETLHGFEKNGITPVGMFTNWIKNTFKWDIREALGWQQGTSMREIFEMSTNNRSIIVNAFREGNKDAVGDAAKQLWGNIFPFLKKEGGTLLSNTLGVGKFMLRGNAFAKIGGLMAAVGVAARIPLADKALEWITGEKDMAHNLRAATNIFNPGGMIDGFTRLGGNFVDMGVGTLSTLAGATLGALFGAPMLPALAISIGVSILGGKAWDFAKGKIMNDDAQVASGSPQIPGQAAAGMPLDKAMGFINQDNPQLASQIQQGLAGV